MFEVLATFVLDGEVHLSKRMYHPPLLGDELEFSSGTVGRVVSRVWKHSNVEAQHVEIHLVRVIKETVNRATTPTAPHIIKRRRK